MPSRSCAVPPQPWQHCPARQLTYRNLKVVTTRSCSSPHSNRDASHKRPHPLVNSFSPQQHACTLIFQYNGVICL